MNNLVIYTDGAYSSSRNQGGIGIVFVKNGEEIMHFSKMYKDTTNNQMEIRAIILALRSIRKPFDSVTIITDSQYCIGTMTQGWKRKKNIELLAVFDKIFAEAKKLNPNITFEWTKGHASDKFNNLADNLAVNASKEC